MNRTLILLVTAVAVVGLASAGGVAATDPVVEQTDGEDLDDSDSDTTDSDADSDTDDEDADSEDVDEDSSDADVEEQDDDDAGPPGFLSGFAQGVFNNDRAENIPAFGVLTAIQDGAAGQEIAQVAQGIGGQPPVDTDDRGNSDAAEGQDRAPDESDRGAPPVRDAEDPTTDDVDGDTPAPDEAVREDVTGDESDETDRAENDDEEAEEDEGSEEPARGNGNSQR